MFTQDYNTKIFIVILTVFFSVSSFAFNLADYVSENVLDVKKEEKISLSASAGIGSRINSLHVNNTYTLWTTNRNFYILALNFNDRTDFEFSVPFKDPEESRAARVESDVRTYTFSYKWNNSFKSSFLYSKNKGYIYEENIENGGNTYKFPELSYDKYSASLFYLTNSKHRSTFLDPLVFKKSPDSSSWLFVLGISYSEFDNLEELSILPLMETHPAGSVQTQSIETRIGYSRNWFWDHWFCAGVLGLGISLNSSKESFNNTENINSNSQSNSFVSLSTGYIWSQVTLGAFANISQFYYQVGKLQLSSSIGNTGIYLSSKF